MANVDAPFGMKPVRHLNGNPWNGGTMRCHISASDSTADMFVGDPVVLDPTNANRGTTVRCPTVIRATMTTGTFIFGVITAFEPSPTNLELKYRVDDTARYCHVCVDPDVIYWIRDNADSAMTKADIGGNADGIFTHTGNTTTGISKMELDSDTQAETAALPLLILAVADVEDNYYDGSTDSHIIWEVMINMHQLRATGDGTGALGVSGD
jgi:hypothetical protein